MISMSMLESWLPDLLVGARQTVEMGSLACIHPSHPACFKTRRTRRHD